MNIGLRILFGYFLIVGLVGYLVLTVFVEEVKPGVRATLEDTLVDTAQVLASLVADDMKAGKIDQARLVTHLQDWAGQSVNMNISGVQKRQLNFQVYITDARGIVVFDSANLAKGRDFSRWNDVYLTLRGQYGARSTRQIADDERSSVMHVAAPIKDGKNIIGVLTVAKPVATISPFIERSQNKILRRSGWLLLASLLIGIGFSWWLSRALGSLQRYAASVERGEKASLPLLGRHEIGNLGRALEAMRVKLEGKQYVEQLMHTLTHELKSPIAAIQASAELLQEDVGQDRMPLADRQHFFAAIIEQNQRQKQLIDKLLALVKLEKQQALHAVAPIALPALLAQVLDDCAPRLKQRQQQLTLECAALNIVGDALLLRQALGNLLDNAIDFAPSGSTITLRCAPLDDSPPRVTIDIIDHGPGIPAYATDRIFERFYSLPRPASGKSTGLGLPFVREVALLHGGSIEITNRAEGGVCASLRLPL
jgi:two-component system sensor histidine kinase CreC